MKELWLETQIKKNPLINQNVDVIIEDNQARFLSNKQTLNIVTASNEMVIEKNNTVEVMRICISDKNSEDLIVKASEQGTSYLVINCANWKIIPLENLIARIKGKSKLIAEVTNAEEA